jgi:DNA-binding MarR family transcriptional regulator
MNGLWIPAALLQRDDLSHTERMVAAFIGSFKQGFFGSNEFIAKSLHIEKRTADRVLSTLSRKGIVGWRGNSRFCAEIHPEMGTYYTCNKQINNT